MKKLLTAALLFSASISFAQQKYTNVKVLSIQVNKCPMERINGMEFDNDRYPDVYATFSAQNRLIYVTDYKEQCSKFPAKFDLMYPFKVQNLEIPYTLTLMDHDRFGDDEPIQKVTSDLVFANYTDYPSEIVLKYKDQSEVVLSVQWY